LRKRNVFFAEIKKVISVSRFEEKVKGHHALLRSIVFVK